MINLWKFDKNAMISFKIHMSVTWADQDTHKPRRWKASSSPKVIYVAYVPTMFAKYNEQVN